MSTCKMLEFFYFYTKGTKGGNPAIKAMLEYFQNSCKEQAVSEELKELHQYVNEVKMLPEVKDDYMFFEDRIYYLKKAAAQEADHKRRVQDILDLLEDYGAIPEELKTYLDQEQDESTLRQWLKLAARTQSLEDFMAACGMA